MYEKPPYSPGLREVLKLAKVEAGRLGHDYVGPDHYLLGIIRKGDGLAAQVLHNLEVDLEDLKADLEGSMELGKGPVVGAVAPNAEAKRVFETMRNIAGEMKHGWNGTEHLLLALIKEAGTLPSKILCGMGIDFERAKREVLDIVEGCNVAMKAKVGAPTESEKGAAAAASEDAAGRPLRRSWVYVDTSVFVGTQDERVDDVSRWFFDLVRDGWYLVLVSPLTLAELSGADDAVRKVYADLPAECIEMVSMDYPQVEHLAKGYVDAGAVIKSRRPDALHVAAATVARADVFLTWCYSRLLDVNRVRRFNGVNVLHGFAPIDFRSPLEMGVLGQGQMYDCVGKKYEIQAELYLQYGAKQDGHTTLLDFVKAKIETSEWVREMRRKPAQKEGE